ncbi:uncharacterized protein G2W53_026354 [Senna tora]|uniref:Uncharacterized protein n=1 Tax=Senna tora TaxID=362788 RepID=A0A834TH15_9FABA|nr:uncharacterized protein G2W53_026354 [Senna tora]
MELEVEDYEIQTTPTLGLWKVYAREAYKEVSLGPNWSL